MKNVILVHGYNGIPPIFSYFKDELEKREYNVIIPEFPIRTDITIDGYIKVFENYAVIFFVEQDNRSWYMALDGNYDGQIRIGKNQGITQAIRLCHYWLRTSGIGEWYILAQSCGGHDDLCIKGQLYYFWLDRFLESNSWAKSIA